MGNTGLCSNTNLLQVIHIVRTVINILQIAVPVALILWGTLVLAQGCEDVMLWKRRGYICTS